MTIIKSLTHSGTAGLSTNADTSRTTATLSGRKIERAPSESFERDIHEFFLNAIIKKDPLNPLQGRGQKGATSLIDRINAIQDPKELQAGLDLCYKLMNENKYSRVKSFMNGTVAEINKQLDLFKTQSSIGDDKKSTQAQPSDSLGSISHNILSAYEKNNVLNLKATTINQEITPLPFTMLFAELALDALPLREPLVNILKYCVSQLLQNKIFQSPTLHESMSKTYRDTPLQIVGKRPPSLKIAELTARPVLSNLFAQFSYPHHSKSYLLYSQQLNNSFPIHQQQEAAHNLSDQPAQPLPPTEPCSEQDAQPLSQPKAVAHDPKAASHEPIYQKVATHLSEIPNLEIQLNQRKIEAGQSPSTLLANKKQTTDNRLWEQIIQAIKEKDVEKTTQKQSIKRPAITPYQRQLAAKRAQVLLNNFKIVLDQALGWQERKEDPCEAAPLLLNLLKKVAVLQENLVKQPFIQDQQKILCWLHDYHAKLSQSAQLAAQSCKAKQKIAKI